MPNQSINAIPAERVEVSAYKGRPDQAQVTFDFRCPNCETVHHKREITRQFFSHVSYALGCGDVCVDLGSWNTKGRK